VNEYRLQQSHALANKHPDIDRHIDTERDTYRDRQRDSDSDRPCWKEMKLGYVSSVD